MKYTRDDVRRFLAEETVFQDAAPAAIERLTDLAVPRSVARDDTFFSAGQPCDALHFLAEGIGLLVRVAPDGRQRILHKATPGEMVGAVAFFDNLGYPASFVAHTTCTVLSFPRTELLRLFKEDGALPLSVIGGLVGRMRLLTALVEKMTFEGAEKRLWDYLQQASTGHGDQFPRTIESLPTREHIASAIGTVREVVSRRLSHLIDTGHLQIEGRRVTLLKPLA